METLAEIRFMLLYLCLDSMIHPEAGFRHLYNEKEATMMSEVYGSMQHNVVEIAEGVYSGIRAAKGEDNMEEGDEI